MPTKMSDSYREQERGSLVQSDNYKKQVGIKKRLARQNEAIDAKCLKKKKTWVFVPPSPMTLILHKDAGSIPGGLVLSVPHEMGRVILCRRLGSVIERDDVAIDAVIEGDLEDAIEALGMGTGL